MSVDSSELPPQTVTSSEPIAEQATEPASEPTSDSTPADTQQEETASNEENPQNLELLDIDVLLPREPHKIKVPVALTETLQDIRQSINENPFTYFYSCFYLEHNGVRLNDFQELSSIPNLKESPVIKLQEDLYTERESRLHIIRLREMLRGFQKPCGKFGYDEGLSVFHAIAPSSESSKKKKKRSEKPINPENISTAAFDDYIFDETFISLRNYLPADSIVTHPKCLRQITLSGWNPVSPMRKLAGDLLYLSVLTTEGKQFEITSSTTGFFVNNCTPEVFDPSRKAPVQSLQAHSLVHLLQIVSSGFRSNFAKIQQRLLATEPMQLFPATTPQVSHPWLATPRTPAFDACRPCEAFLSSGLDFSEGTHDWNEEIQVQRELPHTTFPERLMRDRVLYRIYTEFNQACVQAAVTVAEGNLLAINPNEPESAHMFVHNNLFISRTVDGLGQFDAYGGEVAAYVASSKDIHGVRLLNHLDVEGVATLGAALVDYRGERYVVQSMIPGLFRMSELIHYGTTDSGETVNTDPAFAKLTEKVAELLHLAPHEVSDKAGEKTTFNLSLDCKGVRGAEGRNYLVDLHRLHPVDIAFQETECQESQNGLKPYPHKMTLLRHELVEIFWASKLKAWNDLHNKDNEPKEGIPANEEKTEPQSEEQEPAQANDSGINDSELSTKDAVSTSGSSPKIENLSSDFVMVDKDETSALASSDQDDSPKKEFDLRLNPDVFTTFCPPGSDNETIRADEEHVREASRYIQDVIIPTFINEVKEQTFAPVDSNTLTKVLHARGINMRYLGMIFSKLEEQTNPRFEPVRRVILAEMIIRSCKFHLRSFLRQVTSTMLHDCIAHFLNCLFSLAGETAPTPTLSSADSQYEYLKLTPDSLQSMILDTAATHFRFAVTQSQLESIPRISLLREICLAVGVQILARDYNLDNELSEINCEAESQVYVNVNGSQKLQYVRFRPNDILALLPKVKHTFPTLNYPEEVLESAKLAVTQGQRQLGSELLNEAIAIHEQIYGPIHPETAQCYSNVALIHFHLEEPKSAEELQRKACVVLERALGLDHPETLQALIQYSLYMNTMGRTEECLKMLRFTLDKWYLLYGGTNLDVAYANHNLGLTFQKLGKYEMSSKFFHRACSVYEVLFGTCHTTIAACYSNIARNYGRLNDFKSAIASEKKANAIFTELAGPSHPSTIGSSQTLQDYTTLAVRSAREDKNPRLREMRAQLTAKSAEFSEMVNPALNRGHLPVDDLVEFIDGPSPTSSKPRSKKKGASKK